MLCLNIVNRVKLSLIFDVCRLATCGTGYGRLMLKHATKAILSVQQLLTVHGCIEAAVNRVSNHDCCTVTASIAITIQLLYTYIT